LLVCIESNLPIPGEGVRSVPHVVLVGAAHADTLTQDIRSLAWMVTKMLYSLLIMLVVAPEDAVSGSKCPGMMIEVAWQVHG
jgi:hypothetical protein